MNASAVRTARVGVRQGQYDMPRTSVHRGAGADVQPHTCHTVGSQAEPLGGDVDNVVSHLLQQVCPTLVGDGHCRVHGDDRVRLIELRGFDADDHVPDFELPHELVHWILPMFGAVPRHQGFNHKPRRVSTTNPEPSNHAGFRPQGLA